MNRKIQLAMMGWAAAFMLALAAAPSLADRGRGSIRAAARPEPARAEAHAAPARVEPARPEHAEPARAAPEEHRDVRPAPARVEAPVRRDWDENDADLHHGGGFARGAPVHYLRGRHFHDLPHHIPILYNNQTYYLDDDGNYYLQEGDDYVDVQPPVGALVPELPAGAVAVTFGPTTFYYLDGVFYVPQGGVFAVVNPPPGIVVPDLPDGANQVVVNGNVYYQFGGFNYQPSIQDGVTVYTVIPM